MTGVKVKFATHCRVPFGAYCEVHNENDPSNTTLPRTSRAIALNPTGNLQGSYYFLSLATGKRISRRRWTELPCTEDVIDRVHTIALAEATYDAEVPDFQFSWGTNDPINDDVLDDQEIVEGDNDNDNDDDADNQGAPQIMETQHIGNHGGDEPEEEVEAPDAHEIGAYDARGNQEEGAFDAQEVGAFDAQEEGAHDAQTVGAHDAQTVGAHDAQIDGAHEAQEYEMEEEEIVLENVVDMDEESTVDVVEEAQNPPHYNLRGNKIDYAYKFAFTQLTDIKTKGPNTNIVTDLRNHVATTGFSFNQMGM
jgi:hypothetical protein